MDVEILENEIVDDDDDVVSNILVCKGRFARSRWNIRCEEAVIEFPLLWIDNLHVYVDIKRGLVRLHGRTELMVVEIRIELPILWGRLDTNLLDWRTLKATNLYNNRIRMSIEHKNNSVWKRHTLDLYDARNDKNAWESAWSLILETAFEELPINHTDRCRELSHVLPLNRNLLDLVVEKEARLVLEDSARRREPWFRQRMADHAAIHHFGIPNPRIWW